MFIHWQLNADSLLSSDAIDHRPIDKDETLFSFIDSVHQELRNTFPKAGIECKVEYGYKGNGFLSELVVDDHLGNIHSNDEDDLDYAAIRNDAHKVIDSVYKSYSWLVY